MKPWPKGKSAYSAPRLLKQALGNARKTSLEALDTVIELMRDPETPAATRLAAAGFVWDRAWGGTRQDTALEGHSVPALRIEFVTADNVLRDARVIEHDSNSLKLEEIRDADADQT